MSSLPTNSTSASGPALRHLYLSPQDTIRDAMTRLSTAATHGLPTGIAFVVVDDVLQGVVTDGDIRRGLLAGRDLSDPVALVFRPDPIVFDHRLSHAEILEQIPSLLRQKERYRGGVLEKIILVDDGRRVVAAMDFIDLWRASKALHRRVAVVGMGYVGLTLAGVLADAGFSVTGVEANPVIAERLRRADPHVHEIGLGPLLSQHVGKALTIADAPPAHCEIYIIAVGTPVDADHRPVFRDVLESSRQVGRVLSYGDLVVLRSTCSVGTTRAVVIPALEEASGLRCGRDFFVAFAPERTIEGKALFELRTLPQVIGGFDQNSVDMAGSLFREISPRIVNVSSLEAAELVKLVNNSFRDLKFAFANELAQICAHFNLATQEVVSAANDGYPRDAVALPSPGVGGPCLTKDPYILADSARQAGITNSLSVHGRAVNELMPAFVSAQVQDRLVAQGKRPEDAVVFVVGFAFKGEPETSDVRNSTTVDVVDHLRRTVREVRGFDPVVEPNVLAALGVTPCTLEEGFAGADAVIIANNHRSYQTLDIYRLLEAMHRPAVYCDCWNIFTASEVRKVDGITYLGLGYHR